MSHLKISKLYKTIKFIRKYSKVPICLDTEGAQVRTNIYKKKFINANTKLNIYKSVGNFKLYPNQVFDKLKVGDVLNIGFDGLELKIIRKKKEIINCIVKNSGILENNKGVHIKNRKIKLNYLTDKDFKAIKIAKKNNIRHFALSFTNNIKDISKFKKLLKNKIKIYKIETKSALNNIKKILLAGDEFLIDRGDLSKDITSYMVPAAQKKIILLGTKLKKDIYVATNFLENMSRNKYPTTPEISDVLHTLGMGARGLVLAAETATGKFPKNCVLSLKTIIENYNKYYLKKNVL